MPPAPDAELTKMITYGVHVSLYMQRLSGRRARPRQAGQRPAQRGVDVQARLAVAARRPLVDDRDRDSPASRMPDEPVAGHDGQRGAQHEQSPGLADELVA